MWHGQLRHVQNQQETIEERGKKVVIFAKDSSSSKNAKNLDQIFKNDTNNFKNEILQVRKIKKMTLLIIEDKTINMWQEKIIMITR